MSLHWTLIAGFLYVEIAFLLILLIPFISAKRWNAVFKSRFLKSMGGQIVYYFYVLVAILILFFLDAIREMRKYGDEPSDEHGHPSHLDMQMQTHMRLFRAQRNFYISGFALFLCLVIRRLVTLLTANAVASAERDAAIRQAQSATKAAEQLMDTQPGAAAAAVDANQINELKTQLQEAQEASRSAAADMDVMKSQAENLASEYDRLLAEKDRLERKVNILSEVGPDGDKKDD